ncbi:MAG: hypothetical protein LUF82_00200 [Clostridia bacterium]|nr:hypothetical protein [Clostridia bacterium]
MSNLVTRTTELLEVLPQSDQQFAYEFVKKLVLAWDPDFTKVTEEEKKRIESAEKSGFVDSSEIDWDNIGVD